MMIALKDNTVNSQPIHYDNNAIHQSYSTMNYDYHHHQIPWGKPHYTSFDYSPTPFSMGINSTTGVLSSLETATKANSSFDLTANFNHSTLSRRHTESILPTTSTPSIYSPSNPFNYYHPSEFLFAWNNNPTFMRTQSASFQHYPHSGTFPRFNSIKSTANLSSNPYPSFLNNIPPVNLSFLPPPPAPPPPPPPVLPTSSQSSSIISTQSKRSIPSNRKRSRLTTQLRNEILKLRTDRPTIFIWEIQQNLIDTGICTPQTLPHGTIIQRILNESTNIIKEESKSNTNLVMKKILSKPSPVTICLSPSPSPALSDSESGSECSICLETYRSGQEVSILSCSHEYHSSCIKEWMIKNRSCPMCRKDIHNQPQFVTLLI